MRALLANHWPNSQLASEAATVSNVTMTTTLAMENAAPSVRASVRVRAFAVNSATSR
jgi:hypothetical protein